MTSTDQMLADVAPYAEIHQLSNGVPVLVEECETGIAAVSLWLACGSRDELPHEHGVTHLLEHLLLRRDRAKGVPWQEKVEECGGSFNGATSRDFLCFYYETLAPYALEPLSAFLDSLLDSKEPFTADIVDIEKSIVVEELARAADSLEEEMQNRIHAAVFHNALSRPAGGFIHEVQRLTADIAEAAHRSRWNASQVRMAMCGLPTALILPLLEDSPLADLPASADEQTRGIGEISSRQGPAAFSGSDQIEGDEGVSYLGFGHLGASASDPRRAAFDVAATLLGGSTASRVSRVLREERGLIYGMGAWHTPYRDTGLQTVLMQTSVDKADEAQDSMTEVMAGMLAGSPPTEHEIAIARRQALGGRFTDWQSTVERLLTWGSELLIHGKDGMDLASWAAAVLAVTPTDVMDALAGWRDVKHVQLSR